MEAKYKQKNQRKTQRWSNWMSWNSKHSVRWSDAWFSRCAGWIQRPEISKVIVGWTDGIGSGSSDALGFGNSTDWTSTASTPDDPTVRPAVHLTPSFKSYRDAPRILLHHQMNQRFKSASAVHPTPLFELHSTTPSGCYSAPDRPTVRRNIALVHLLGHLCSTAI
jgi:hypothetical protein